MSLTVRCNHQFRRATPVAMRFIVCLLSLLTLTAGAASASPIFWTEISGHVTTPQSGPIATLNDSFDSGQQIGVQTIALTTVSVTNPDGSDFGFAISKAQATDGLIGVSTAASPGNLGYSNLINATALAQFFDTLTITSSTLAAGTTVHLAFSIDPTYDFTGDCAIGGAATLDAMLTGPTGAFGTFSDNLCGGTTGTRSGTISVVVGQEFGVLASIATSATGGKEADALHTLHFSLDPVENFSYTTASGQSYLTPKAVPKPDMMAMMLFGASAALTRRRSGR